MAFPIARISLETGLVVNVELADQEWLDAHANDPDFTFEPYVAEEPAIIGLGYDPSTGFEQPPEQP
jgi:hypothetical protein